MDYAWICSCCGQQFDTLPLDVGFKAPDNWFGIPEAERGERDKLESDICFLGGDIYVRGCIEIPIIGQNELFIWGAWCSVSKASFSRILELWSAADVGNEPPFFGWLSNNISAYPDTTNLKTNLHLRGANIRPLILLEPTEHPLAIDQSNGITLDRVKEIVAKWHK